MENLEDVREIKFAGSHHRLVVDKVNEIVERVNVLSQNYKESTNVVNIKKDKKVSKKARA
jgi:hypothetical protein